MNQLPHRFTEKSFRRYEATIRTIVDRYPQPTTILANQLGLSLCTISNRLRDAMRSLKDNKWSTTLNMTKFNDIYDSILVTESNDAVVVKFKGVPAELVEVKEDSFFRMKTDGLNPVFVPATFLSVVGLLASAGVLNRPVYSMASDEQIQELEASFDVSASKQPDGSWKII